MTFQLQVYSFESVPPHIIYIVSVSHKPITAQYLYHVTTHKPITALSVSRDYTLTYHSTAQWVNCKGHGDIGVLMHII